MRRSVYMRQQAQGVNIEKYRLHNLYSHAKISMAWQGESGMAWRGKSGLVWHACLPRRARVCRHVSVSCEARACLAMRVRVRRDACACPVRRVHVCMACLAG